MVLMKTYTLRSVEQNKKSRKRLTHVVNWFWAKTQRPFDREIIVFSTDGVGKIGLHVNLVTGLLLCLASFNILFLRFIHVVCIFLFSIPLLKYTHNLFIYSPTGRHLDCFQFLAFLKIYALKILREVFLGTYAFVSWDTYPQV